MKAVIANRLKLTLLGLFVGGALGFILGLVLYWSAVREMADPQRTQGMYPDQIASYLCGVGMAPTALGILGILVGTGIGLVIGIIILIKKNLPPVPPQEEAACLRSQ